MSTTFPDAGSSWNTCPWPWRPRKIPAESRSTATTTPHRNISAGQSASWTTISRPSMWAMWSSSSASRAVISRPCLKNIRVCPPRSTSSSAAWSGAVAFSRKQACQYRRWRPASATTTSSPFPGSSLNSSLFFFCLFFFFFSLLLSPLSF